MPPDFRSTASFHTTRWTIVLSAAQNRLPEGRWALAELFRVCLYPLCMFARRRGHSPDDAQDLTQGFFLYLVEQRALASVNPVKGKFRSFLLVSFANRLGLTTSGIKTLIHRLRKRYRTLSREEVARAVSGPAETDEEIRGLCEALIAAEGRLAP